MNEDVITDIIRKRQLQPFKSITEINEFVKEPGVLENIITVKSRIFKITIKAEGDNGFCRFITYYDRDEKKILYCSVEH